MSQFQWTIEETQLDRTNPHSGKTYQDTIPVLKLNRHHGLETEAVSAAIKLQSAKGDYVAVVDLTTRYSSHNEINKAAAAFRDSGWNAGVTDKPNPQRMILTLRKSEFSNLETAASETEAVISSLERTFMTAATHIEEMRKFAADTQPEQ